MSELFKLYLSLGNKNYGEAIGKIAPYFDTIKPEFVDLKPGYCEIVIRNTRAVHNHLGTVHAIAMCNGAELAAGLMTDVSIPEGRRWIPVGMTVKYLAMAKTDLRVVAQGRDIDWTVTGEIEVPVEIIDSNNINVLEAKIIMKVSEVSKC